MAKLVATVGFLTTTLTIALSLMPQPDEPNKALAMLKVIGLTAALLLMGVVIFYWPRIRSAFTKTAS